MTSSLNRINEILALGKPRSLICSVESAIVRSLNLIATILKVKRSPE
ncbi:MAG: hypothetical protein V7K97_15720 [Nostoc sp.]